MKFLVVGPKNVLFGGWQYEITDCGTENAVRGEVDSGVLKAVNNTHRRRLKSTREQCKSKCKTLFAF